MTKLCHFGIRIYLLILFAAPLVSSQHVVFEEIGRFAGATSYIHVALHLDLDDIHQHLENYAAQIEVVRQQVQDYDLSLLRVDGYAPTDVVEDLIQRHKEAHDFVLDLALEKYRHFQ